MRLCSGFFPVGKGVNGVGEGCALLEGAEEMEGGWMERFYMEGFILIEKDAASSRAPIDARKVVFDPEFGRMFEQSSAKGEEVGLHLEEGRRRTAIEAVIGFVESGEGEDEPAVFFPVMCGEEGGNLRSEEVERGLRGPVSLKVRLCQEEVKIVRAEDSREGRIVFLEEVEKTIPDLLVIKAESFFRRKQGAGFDPLASLFDKGFFIERNSFGIASTEGALKEGRHPIL